MCRKEPGEGRGWEREAFPPPSPLLWEAPCQVVWYKSWCFGLKARRWAGEAACLDSSKPTGVSLFFAVTEDNLCFSSESRVFRNGCHLSSTRYFNCLLPAQPSPPKHVTKRFPPPGASSLSFSISAQMLPPGSVQAAPRAEHRPRPELRTSCEHSQCSERYCGFGLCF